MPTARIIIAAPSRARARWNIPPAWRANLEALIQREGPDTIAAMIVEPVMGAGGAIVPPDGYFDAITKVLDKYAIPLIDDEVITGFGRTGEWFGCAKYGFEPDSMSHGQGAVQRLSADLARCCCRRN